jgi:hypothetical protein
VKEEEEEEEDKVAVLLRVSICMVPLSSFAVFSCFLLFLSCEFRVSFCDL